MISNSASIVKMTKLIDKKCSLGKIFGGSKVEAPDVHVKPLAMLSRKRGAMTSARKASSCNNNM